MAKSKVQKTRDAVFADPVNGNIDWKDVEAVFDRPHPRRECGRGLVKRVRTFLTNSGHALPPKPPKKSPKRAGEKKRNK